MSNMRNCDKHKGMSSSDLWLTFDVMTKSEALEKMGSGCNQKFKL